MLSRRHCPHTGIVNFFAAADPLLAIGSVIRAGEPALYHWRYYLGQASAVGVAPDMRSAENHLLTRHREYLREPEQAGDEPSVSDRRSAAALLAAGGRR
jgi:hypothetical protein